MRNGRPYAIKIATAAVIAFAALAVGYGLGEQAQLGEQPAQTVTQEIRHTGDVKRLCLTVKTGGAYPLDRNHRRTFDALEELDYIEHASWGRWQITPLGETVAKQLTAKERNL